MKGIKTVLSRMNELPSQPEVVRKLNELVRHDDITSDKVAKVIETDQGFTARVLRLVNSPFYGFARRIASIRESITMLGFNAIHQLLLTTSLLSAFKIDSGVLDLKGFWKHSFGVGVMAKHLLRSHDDERQNDAFIGGILHDVGRLVVVKLDAEAFLAYYPHGIAFTDLDKEREFFGMDHQTLGRLLAEKWSFPQGVQTAIAHHHSPPAASQGSITTSAIHVADVICHAMCVGERTVHKVTEFFPEAWRSLELSRYALDEIIRGALQEIEDTEQILNEIG